MTFALRYVKENKRTILLQFIFVGVYVVVFYLYELPLIAVLYPAFLCFIIGSIGVGFSLYKEYINHKKLEQMESLQANVLMDALVDLEKTSKDNDYQKIIMNLCREIQMVQEDKEHSNREILEYFTIWVHQIKTPIASMRLQLEAEDNKMVRRLNSEVLHMEQYVDMVLTYLKTNESENDFVFRSVSIDKILKENIRKLRNDFILKKINLVYEPFEEFVISDEKWLSFVVGQVLSNALKYTKEGAVTITLEKSKTLLISDTGIGIAPEDIPRIFEKGYTGCNGRKDKRASGLGLYLCKQILNQLGHTISITSKAEMGTTVRIDLSQYHDRTKEM